MDGAGAGVAGEEAEAEVIYFIDEVEVDDDLICVVYDDNLQQPEEEESDADDESENGDVLSGYESDESSGAVEETFPYMDSETDEEDLPWERRSRTQLDDDIITLDNEEEEEEVLKKILKERGRLTCLRCPRDRNEFLELDLFLLHQTRHLGRNHFMCVECKKTFVKYSFCLAHEIRKHGQDFPKLEFPAVLLAREYVKEKTELKKNAPKVPRGVEWSEEEKIFEEIGGILENPDEESDGDTDEDDPKFCPGNVVASTSLYPYRGPPVTMHYQAYEVQLKYGRERRTAVNTVSRVALLHRKYLERNGFLPDQNRTSKYHVREHVLDEWGEEPASKSKSAASRQRNQAQKAKPSAKNQRRKKTARRKTGDRKERNVRRTFVSSIIRRTCLLCQFTWSTETELREHRTQRHPNRKLFELMTVISEPKNKKGKKKGLENDEDLFQPIKVPKEVSSVKYSKGPEPELEAFMATLGLISVQKLNQIQRPNMGRRLRMSVRKQTKPCSVVIEAVSVYKLPKKGYPVFTCDKCDYFVAGKKYLDSHRIVKHGDSISSIAAQEASNSSSAGGQIGSDTSKESKRTGKRKALSNPKGGTPKKKMKDAIKEPNNCMNVEEPDWRSSTNPEVIRSLIGTSSSS